MGVNTFLTNDWFSMTMLRLLVNPLEVTMFLNTRFNKDYQKEFAVGATVNIKYPPQFVIRDGMDWTPQGISEIQTVVNCNQAFGIDFQWSDLEAALDVERGDDRISDLYIKGPMAQIAQEWDSRSAYFAYANSNNIVGVLGTDPTTLQSFSYAARQRIVEMAGGVDGKSGIVIPPQVNTSLVPAQALNMNPADEISREFKKGVIGVNAGYNWHESMSLYDHTAGTWAGAVTVNGAGQSGNSLTVTATAGDTFLVGDVVGIGGTTNVNPRTRRRTNSTYTKTVCITVALVAAGGGVDVITFTPALYGPGSPYQNISALPANGAALTLFPGTVAPNGKTGKNGLLMIGGGNTDAAGFTIVNVPLELPKNEQIARQQRHPETGMAVRLVKFWDPTKSRMGWRFDTLGGYGILYNDNCSVRLLSA
jgi:hypothetical protein